MKINSLSFGVLNVTLFILQSTIARCRDNRSIPNITSNSLKDNSIKSPKNSYSRILMGQSLYTLFIITLYLSGFVNKMSYSVSLHGKLPKLGMSVPCHSLDGRPLWSNCIWLCCSLQCLSYLLEDIHSTSHCWFLLVYWWSMRCLPTFHTSITI